VSCTRYSAGVYANPLPANQDIWSVSPVPDEIWVAKYDDNATIWHLGALQDTPWVTNQRSHQYLNYSADQTGETYGGVSFNYLSSCIDRDIDDARAGGTNGVKAYSSWTVTIVDYPDSPPNTAIYGINSGYMEQLDSTGNPIPPILTGMYCVQCNLTVRILVSIGRVGILFRSTTP
jgi:hypothetical protein